MEALEYFKSGFSCSESIIKEAVDIGICDEAFVSAATAFSGGMGSGCLCGAVSASQMVIGIVFGRNNKFGNEVIARAKAKEFIEKFKTKYPATCCRVLSKDFEFHSIERKEHCKKIVDYCSKLLKDMVMYEHV